MGIVHIPRTAAAVARGYTKRRLSPLSDREKSLVGMGAKNPPHVYASRAGLFDVDIMFHMNNASYLTHAELARWEWSAFGGLFSHTLKSESFFIVSASILRFRREIAPLQKFEIETRVGSIDNRNCWVYQTFHNSATSNNARGKVLAQVFTQAVIVKRGKGVINPRPWLEEFIPSESETWDDLSTKSKDVQSLFDEKSTKFMDLEDTLRTSAALHDDKVTRR